MSNTFLMQANQAAEEEALKEATTTDTASDAQQVRLWSITGRVLLVQGLAGLGQGCCEIDTLFSAVLASTTILPLYI